MSRRPDFAQHQPDPRFDRYRDRVGRLFRDRDEAGLVLVVAEPYAELIGGRLWWRRWTRTRDVLWLWTLVDGQHSDTVLTDDEASQEELLRYDEGRFDYYGESLRVVWTDPEESARLRQGHFER